MSANTKKKGFSLVELILVMALGITIAALTIPFGIRFFQVQSLEEQTQMLRGTLRRAEQQSVAQKNDNAFGVKILAGSYVVFQGASYAARTVSEDETIVFPSSITPSGVSEVVFAKRTGIPGTTGVITLAAGSDIKTITINAKGLISTP